MPIRVEEYLREDNSNPYRRWFDSLDPQSAAKVTTVKLRLELGNTSSIKWFAKARKKAQTKAARPAGPRKR
jgi:hypothetical protein